MTPPTEHASELRELRETAGLTQAAVAAKMSIAQNRISQIEHGRLDRLHLDTLSRYFTALGFRLVVTAETADGSRKIVLTPPSLSP